MYIYTHIFPLDVEIKSQLHRVFPDFPVVPLCLTTRPFPAPVIFGCFRIIPAFSTSASLHTIVRFGPPVSQCDPFPVPVISGFFDFPDLPGRLTFNHHIQSIQPGHLFCRAWDQTVCVAGIKSRPIYLRTNPRDVKQKRSSVNLSLQRGYKQYTKAMWFKSPALQQQPQTGLST